MRALVPRLWARALLLCAAFSLLATAPRDVDAPADAGPRVELEALPRIGFPPLKVTLVGTLKGVSRDDENFCHVDQVWIARRASEPDTRQRISARRPRCQHSPDEKRVELRFYKDLTLASGGLYIYRLALEPKDGPPLVSKPVTVQVLTRP